MKKLAIIAIGLFCTQSAFAFSTVCVHGPLIPFRDGPDPTHYLNIFTTPLPIAIANNRTGVVGFSMINATSPAHNQNGVENVGVLPNGILPMILNWKVNFFDGHYQANWQADAYLVFGFPVGGGGVTVPAGSDSCQTSGADFVPAYFPV